MTFFRYRLGLQGFPRAAASGSNSLKLGNAALVVLASSSERLGMAETALTASSLVGFVRSCPAADITVARPLQTAFRTNCACTPPIPSRMPSSAARYHACCKFHPRGFSPPRRFAPRDGFGCFAIRASQSSLRFPFHRPPLSGKPRPGGTKEEPFPQRGHPTKNLRRLQAVTPRGAPVALMRLPPSRCRPESPTPLLGPLQGFTPLTTLDCLHVPLPVR